MATGVSTPAQVIDPDACGAEPVEEPGAQDVRIQELITERDGAPNFTMRRFEVMPGGYTPQHAHAWEHEVYILEGGGVLAGPAGDQPYRAGQAVYVPPFAPHRFRNTGSGPLRFLCVVPQRTPGV